jgi:hypothetical protein
MHAYNPTLTPIVKGNKYGSFQSPRNQYEIDQMKSVPYALAVRSLMYAQVCTCPGLAFITGMLDRYEIDQIKNFKKTKSATESSKMIAHAMYIHLWH